MHLPVATATLAQARALQEVTKKTLLWVRQPEAAACPCQPPSTGRDRWQPADKGQSPRMVPMAPQATEAQPSKEAATQVVGSGAVKEGQATAAGRPADDTKGSSQRKGALSLPPGLSADQRAALGDLKDPQGIRRGTGPSRPGEAPGWGAHVGRAQEKPAPYRALSEALGQAPEAGRKAAPEGRAEAPGATSRKAEATGQAAN